MSDIASDEIRDGLAVALGDFFVWLFSAVLSGTAGLGILAVIGVGIVLWQLSLLFGPNKVHWRCGGKGYVRGLLGGKRKCSCDGGLTNRIGAKK